MLLRKYSDWNTYAWAKLEKYVSEWGTCCEENAMISGRVGIEKSASGENRNEMILV